ncbi:MAG: hypothetical protein CSA33_01550 [Desulfobulbus propionicus]|nr:MAG: hypothetical protein CSA33_01550 [Desulfobulbus propionicus]
MDPAALIPVPDALPVHWYWFDLMLLLTFFLHIVFMNVMLGTACIVTLTHLFSKGEGSLLCESTAQGLPSIIALTVNLGVAPLLFIQVLYGHLLYTSSILMGVFWLWIIGTLITAYYLAYLYKYKYNKLHSGRFLLTAAITLLLLFIGFVFTNNTTLMLNPGSWTRYFDQPHGFLLNTADKTILPRYLHFITSAIAVGGLSLALFFSGKVKKGDLQAGAMVTQGCQWFTGATLVNFASGTWFLESLPQGLLTSSGTPVWFLIFLFCGITSGIVAAVLAMREQVHGAAASALLSIFFMVLVRDRVRSAFLEPWFSPTELTVQPQYAPLLLFLIICAGGLLLIVWMIRLVMAADKKQEARS